MTSQQSEAKPEVRLSHLAGKDARAALADNPVIFLPMGSHEDQGPHFPMGDYLFADRVAEIAAQEATMNGTPTFVAPVLPYGGEDYFRSMIGGIVLEQSTLTAVLLDMMHSLIDNGLTRIVIVNGHSGNVTPIGLATRQIHRETEIVVPSLYLWEAAYGMLPDIVGAEQSALRAGHGADPLGSVGLHLMPDLVRLEHRPAQARLKRDPLLNLPFTNLGKAKLGQVEIGMPNDYSDILNDGVANGDPNLCDADTGRELTKRLSGCLAMLAATIFANT